MMRAFLLGLTLSLFAFFAQASGETLSYERFSLMTNAEKDRVIILTMKFMAEMEGKIERQVTETSEWKRLRDVFLSDAYAAPLKNWKDYSTEFSTLLKKQNSVQCVYAGWVSKVVGGFCVQPSTLPTSSAEYKTYVSSGGCGAGGTTEIACNPVIFGFKEAQKGSLFCVPAGAKAERAHNSSLRCMDKALNSTEGDSRESRLAYLRNQLSRPENKNIIEDVYKFLNKVCLCPDKVPGLAPKYEEYMQPHRTCYSLMRMLAENVICEDPSQEVLDTTFFREVRNLSTPQGLDNKAFDQFYANFLKDLRTQKSSEIQAICQGDGSNPFTQPNTALSGNQSNTATAKLDDKPTQPLKSETENKVSDGIVVTSNNEPKKANPIIEPQQSVVDGPKTSAVTDPGPITPVTVTQKSDAVTTPETSEDIVVMAKTCKATCYVPKGKLDDATTPMDCFVGGVKLADNSGLLDTKISVPQMTDGKKATHVPARYMDQDPDADDSETKKEYQIDCKISEVKEWAPIIADTADLKFTMPPIDFGPIPKFETEDEDADTEEGSKSDDKKGPSISVSVKTKLQNNITFTAEVKDESGKSKIPEGWTLVWFRKNVPKGVTLPKPKSPASSTTKKDSQPNLAEAALAQVDKETKEDPATEKPEDDKASQDKPAEDKPAEDKPSENKSTEKPGEEKSAKTEPEETKLPDGSFDEGSKETTQPRASQPYEICASIVKGSKKEESCSTVDKLQVTNPASIGGPMQAPLQGITPGAFSAGGVQ